MGINVAILENNRGYRDKLAKYLNESSGYHCTYACGSAEDALKVVPRLLPDVVLIDIHLANMSGAECTRQLKDLCPSVRILVLTVYEDTERIFGALKSGASGYLLKCTDPADILHAIQKLKLGGVPMSSQIACQIVKSFGESPHGQPRSDVLSQHEREILQKISQGYSSEETSEILSISVTTVNTHLQHIYEKLHVRSRTEAVLKHLR